MIKILPNFLTNKKYIVGLVDEVVFFFVVSKKISDLKITNFDFCEKFINARYTLSSGKSVREDVMRRDMLDKLLDGYFGVGKDIGIEEFIYLIISVERFGLHCYPSTQDLVRSRLSYHGI